MRRFVPALAEASIISKLAANMGQEEAISDTPNRSYRRRAARRIAIGLVTMMTGLIVVGSIVGYLRAKALDDHLRRDGSFDGLSYPEDALNKSFKPFRIITKSRGLQHEVVTPVAIHSLSDDHRLIDFGKARFGALAIVLPPNVSAGSVEVGIGERVTPDRQVWHYDPANGRKGSSIAHFKQRLLWERATDRLYVEGPERLRPTARDLPLGLKSVFPFRYAEIGGKLPAGARLQQVAIHYPFDRTASEFSSSSPVLDRIWNLAKHSVEATSFAGLYVDGNRERLPYEADAYIAQMSHSSLEADRNLSRRTLEYLLGNPTWPSEWRMFPILAAFEDYQYTGDLTYLRQIYPQLRQRTLIELEQSNGLISTKAKALEKLPPALRAAGPMSDIVDWPASERDDYAMDAIEWRRYARLSFRAASSSLLAMIARASDLDRAALYYAENATSTKAARYVITDQSTVVNAFHYAALARMAKIATALDIPRDADRYSRSAERVRGAMNNLLWDEHRGSYRDGPETSHRSLHASLFPLAFDIVPQARKERVISFIKSRGLACSVYASQFLLDGLYASGEGDYAYSLLAGTSSRSWFAMTHASGSTITTEAWNEDVKPNQDWSHVWGTAPANIIARWVMGIRPIEPGFARFIVQPQPGLLQHAVARVPTVKGEIRVAFRTSGKEFSMVVNVPHDTRAQLWLPYNIGNSQAVSSVLLDGTKVDARLSGRFLAAGEVGPGEHRVQLRLH